MGAAMGAAMGAVGAHSGSPSLSLVSPSAHGILRVGLLAPGTVFHQACSRFRSLAVLALESMYSFGLRAASGCGATKPWIRVALYSGPNWYLRRDGRCHQAACLPDAPFLGRLALPYIDLPLPSQCLSWLPGTCTACAPQH